MNSYRESCLKVKERLNGSCILYNCVGFDLLYKKVWLQCCTFPQDQLSSRRVQTQVYDSISSKTFCTNVNFHCDMFFENNIGQITHFILFVRETGGIK